MVLTLCGMLIGAIVGLRFTVLALIPTSGCVTFFAAIRFLLGASDLGSTVTGLVLLLTFLQMGYLGGSALHFFWIERGARLWARYEGSWRFLPQR
jgi:hypothetical protein